MSLTDGPALRALFEQAEGALARALPLTPAAVQRPVQSLKETAAGLHAAFDGVGYDISKLPATVVMKLLSPDVLSDTSALDSYLDKACRAS